jgi:hypothetical protein
VVTVVVVNELTVWDTVVVTVLDTVVVTVEAVEAALADSVEVTVMVLVAPVEVWLVEVCWD